LIAKQKKRAILAKSRSELQLKSAKPLLVLRKSSFATANLKRLSIVLRRAYLIQKCPPEIMSMWLLPPAGKMLLALRWRPRIGVALLLAGLLLLWVCATPVAALWQLRAVESEVPRAPLAGTGARAIVVLGAGSYIEAPEYGTDTVSAQTLERVRYAARLYRLTGVPIMLSGGSPRGAHSSAAEQMRDVLIQELTTPVTWLESSALDTLESAVRCEKVLHEEGIKKVLLVTHAWHMWRARAAFEHAGLEVVPAPVGFAAAPLDPIRQLLPDAQAMVLTHRAWHEPSACSGTASNSGSAELRTKS
jgi:uncharacterized SAM-binding protein YcdF (DUF218 family)